MLIRHADRTAYSEELTHCDASQPEIVAALACAVPINILRTSPFSYTWGSSIYAKVQAINEFGASSYSAVGNNAIIITNPDAPVHLAENLSQKSESTIGLTWSNGASNGGAAVLDYSVSYD